ncbi:MAG TPA: hypothetical protein EYN18_08525 [Nitrospirales bacterium]|nr:hypothetical protein [Nitrospirales bacterium]
MTAINKTQFQNMLKKFDTNGDHMLDNQDVQRLLNSAKAEKVGKGILGFLTFGLSTLFTGTGSKKDGIAQELQKLLTQDNDACISWGDVQKSCQSYKRSNGRSCNSSNPTTSSSDLQDKLNTIRAAKETDLKNVKDAWKSDDLARNLVQECKHLLKGASLQDLAFLLNSLRDAGSGTHSSINKQDRAAMQTILESVSPEDRAKLIDMAGGEQKMASIFTNGSISSFRQMFSQRAGKSTRTSSPVNSSTTNPCRDSGAASSTSTASLRARSGNQLMPTLRDAMSASKKALQKLKGASKEDRQQALIEYQEAKQWEQQIFNMITNMMKKDHETKMAIIRNLG